MKNRTCRQNMASVLWHWRRGEFHSHPAQSFYRSLHSIDQQQRSPLELEAIILGVTQTELFERHMLHLFGLGGNHKESGFAFAAQIQKEARAKSKKQFTHTGSD
jgi:predicted Zn-dependent protease